MLAIAPKPTILATREKMKINVVTVKSGWILSKIAERIVMNAPPDVEMELTYSPRRGENNFYVDVTNCYRGRSGGKDVGLFTHVHENDNENIKFWWHTLDHIIHMSRRSYSLFLCDYRYDQFKPPMTCKMPGEIPEGFEYTKPTIGIFQRGKHEGKGHGVMHCVIDSPIATSYKWLFIGSGWGDVVIKLKGKADVRCIQDSECNYPQDYLAEYNNIDYLLIPSKWEGGPMSLIEAAALGIPIIASRVGWVENEIPVDYPFDDVEDLIETLATIVYRRESARKIVEKLSYADYALYVADIFRGIK